MILRIRKVKSVNKLIHIFISPNSYTYICFLLKKFIPMHITPSIIRKHFNFLVDIASSCPTPVSYLYPGYSSLRTPDIRPLVPRIFIPPYIPSSYLGYSSPRTFPRTPDIHPLPRTFPRTPDIHSLVHSIVPRIFIPSLVHSLVPWIFIPSYPGYAFPRTPDTHSLVPWIFIPSYPGPRTPDIHSLVS